MAFPAALIPKLSKLIPRLATDHDGEVIATVRAIGRTLKSEGADFHDLAAALDAPPRIVERIVEKTMWRDRPAPAKPPSAVPDTYAELAQWLKARSNRLAQHEASFVSDMACKLWGNQEPTEKQGKWMRALYSKVVCQEQAA